MNYEQLQDRIAGTLHRTDLTLELPNFILDAQDKICRRYGIDLAPFSAPTDTDEVLTGSPLLYVYASLISACLFLRDEAGAAMWSDAWDIEASREVVTSGRAWTDPYTSSDGAPPVISRVR